MALRLITKSKRRKSAKPLYKKLGVLEFEKLYTKCLLNFQLAKHPDQTKALLQHNAIQHQRTTRHRSTTQIRTIRTKHERTKHCFQYEFLKIFDDLPSCLKQFDPQPKSHLKNNIVKFLSNQN